MEEKILKMYADGISLTKIGNTLNISRWKATKIVRENGIEIVNKQNLLRVREDLFQTIETEEDAYWLGFIYADGYISDGGEFELSLKSTDSGHLHKFAKFINYTGNIVDKQPVKCKGKTYYRCRLAFRAKSLSQRFSDLGIVPRKSCILTYPKYLKEELHKHFIRGYTDGDGSFNLYTYKQKELNKRNGKPRLDLLDFRYALKGTKDVLLNIQKIFNINTKLFDRHRNQCSYSFNTGGRHRVINILNYLYQDSTIHLDRKYEIYQKIAVHQGNLKNYYCGIKQGG